MTRTSRKKGTPMKESSTRCKSPGNWVPRDLQSSWYQTDLEPSASVVHSPFRFLDLPREIRDMIYELLCCCLPQQNHDYTRHCLEIDARITENWIGLKSKPACKWQSILIVNWQISEEFMDVLYGGMSAWIRNDYVHIACPNYSVDRYKTALWGCPAMQRFTRRVICELDYDAIVYSQGRTDIEEEIKKHQGGAELLIREILLSFDNLRFLKLEIKPSEYPWPVDGRLVQALLPFLEIEDVNIELEGDVIGLPDWPVQLYNERLQRLHHQLAKSKDAAHTAKLARQIQDAERQSARYIGRKVVDIIHDGDLGKHENEYKAFYCHRFWFQKWYGGW